VVELLIPFLQGKGCRMPVAVIEEIYHAYSLGRGKQDSFWAACGIAGEAGSLDAEYLERHQLTEGLREFLTGLRRRGHRICCLSNDLAAWSQWLRERHGLTATIEAWTISGEVGCRKPNAEIYRAMLDAMKAVPADCVFLDDRPRNLDAANKLGMRTFLFGLGDKPQDSGSHVLVSSFADALKEIDRFASRECGNR
jgi:HAD superfamily hydrolase (TIGR01509 family)